MNDHAFGYATEKGEPPETELEQLACELVDDWNKGTPLSLRAYLSRRPGLRERPAAVLELINQEVELRQVRGETPRPGDYIADFPELSQSLMRLFEVHALASSCDRPDTVPRVPALPVAGHVPGAATGSVPLIPGYEIERVLGRGGMGIVYLALQLGMNRHVALKLLRETAEDNSSQIARFRREAEAAARCQHPNLVQIYDFGQQAGEFYIAMEYVPGGHLGRAMAGKPQPPERSAELIETLARAIDHAHAQGVVHRDLKPANILMALDGEPKIGDFGLAKLKDSTTQTELGTLLGTIAYMAPEQVGSPSNQIGNRTDVHALGAILYEALTGRPPYRGGTPQQVLHSILTEEVIPPSQRQSCIPRDLEAVCLKCLEKRPADRYATAADLAEDLRRFLDGRPTLARPVPLAARLWRWCRRNPKLAIVSTALAATLFVAAVAFTGLAYRHNIRLSAEIARTRDKDIELSRDYQESRSALQSMLAHLNDARFRDTPRMKELGHDLMEVAADYYDRRLRRRGSASSEVQEDTARAFGVLSTVDSQLGDMQRAEEHVRKALQLVQSLLAAHPGNDGYLGLQVECCNRLSNYLVHLGHREEARTVAEKAVTLAEEFAARDPRDGVRAELAAVCHDTYANNLRQAGKMPEALDHLRTAVRIRETLIKTRETLDPSKYVNLIPRHLATLRNEAVTLWNAGKPAEADERFRQLEPRVLSLPGEQRDSLGAAQLYVSWSGVLCDLKRFDDAVSRADAGLAQIQPYLQLEPNDAEARLLCLMLHGNRGHALTGLGKYRESVEEWRVVMNLSGQDVVTESRVGLAFALLGAGEFEQAVAEAQKVKAGDNVSAVECYNLACIFARAAAACGNTRVPQDERTRCALSYSSDALGWLKAAAERGCFPDPAIREHAKKDPDLAILRDRPEFGKIIDSSGTKP
jgi:tetratricopeptide (TPR) repeat protein